MFAGPGSLHYPLVPAHTCLPLSGKPPPMTLTLFDLSGKSGSRFSPYCWRARLALAHKGLERDCKVEHVRFTDKDKLSFTGQKLVPVLQDGETVVADSWAIACYLEDTYSDRPSLFGGDAGRGSARLIANWVNQEINPRIGRSVVADVMARIEPVDHEYFRSSREARYGMTLEEAQAGREERLPELMRALEPARGVLRDQPYIGGETPLFSDYALFSAFAWARIVSPFQLLEPTDPLYDWRERLLDAFDGLARSEAAAA